MNFGSTEFLPIKFVWMAIQLLLHADPHSFVHSKRKCSQHDFFDLFLLLRGGFRSVPLSRCIFSIEIPTNEFSPVGCIGTGISHEFSLIPCTYLQRHISFLSTAKRETR